MQAGDRDSGVRLAELAAAFSLAMDLGLGQPLEHMLRSWLIAARLADRLDVGPRARSCLYYVMMLAWVGCVADTAEVAAWFGDDIAYRHDSYRVDLAGLPMMGFALRHAGTGSPAPHRLRVAASLVLAGRRAVARGLMSHCLTTARVAERPRLDGEGWEPFRQVVNPRGCRGVAGGVGVSGTVPMGSLRGKGTRGRSAARRNELETARTNSSCRDFLNTVTPLINCGLAPCAGRETSECIHFRRRKRPGRKDRSRTAASEQQSGLTLPSCSEGY